MFLLFFFKLVFETKTSHGFMVGVLLNTKHTASKMNLVNCLKFLKCIFQCSRKSN